MKWMAMAPAEVCDVTDFLMEYRTPQGTGLERRERRAQERGLDG